eukprot:8726-Heterococcus_DN1.PRE.4
MYLTVSSSVLITCCRRACFALILLWQLQNSYKAVSTAVTCAAARSNIHRPVLDSTCYKKQHSVETAVALHTDWKSDGHRAAANVPTVTSSAIGVITQRTLIMPDAASPQRAASAGNTIVPSRPSTAVHARAPPTAASGTPCNRSLFQ